MCSADAVKLVGVTLQGGAQIRAGREAQAAATSNARIANAQAEAALRKGRFEERAVRRNVDRLIGSQIAAAAASGVNPGAGTAVDIQAGTARIGETDAMTIRENAFLEASGYKMQAKQYKRAARSARNEGFLNGAGTLLGGYGTIFASKPKTPPALFGNGSGAKSGLGTSTFGTY